MEGADKERADKEREVIGVCESERKGNPEDDSKKGECVISDMVFNMCLGISDMMRI